jgi:hypothetical protein
LDTYFVNKEAVRQDVQKMVGRIMHSFVNLVEATPWLSDADKVKNQILYREEALTCVD